MPKCAYCGEQVDEFPLEHYAKCRRCFIMELTDAKWSNWTWAAIGFLLGSILGWGLCCA